MSMDKNLLNLLYDNSFEEYDLKTDEGYNKFNEDLNKIKNDADIKFLFTLCNIDFDKLVNEISDLANMVHKEAKKDANKVEDKKFIRPSEKLDYDHQLQLHKIVQEYIDTMIKPFNNGSLTDTQINDAYAGLYEFAAWVMNK